MSFVFLLLCLAIQRPRQLLWTPPAFMRNQEADVLHLQIYQTE